MVSNEEYESALKNQDNSLIMHYATLNFIHMLTYDELHRCKLIALWGALKSWKLELGGKFTSFLYKRVYWECLKTIEQNNKYNDINLEYINQETLPNTPINETLEILSDDLKSMIEKRYIHNMTLREIGDIHHCSYETVRKRLKKAIKKLKMVYN